MNPTLHPFELEVCPSQGRSRIEYSLRSIAYRLLRLSAPRKESYMKSTIIIPCLIFIVATFIGQFHFVQPSMAQEPAYPRPMSYYVTNYNFSPADVTTTMPPKARENLRYYLENILSVMPPEFDAQLVIWWAYIERILDQKDGPWVFSNCADKDHNVSTDCVNHFTSGGWQVGYGIQVYDHILRLEKTFNYVHKGKKPWEIGDEVLAKSGQTTVTFPRDLTLHQMMHDPRGVTSGRSNAYWASVLMRHPKISAYLLAQPLYNWECYGKKRGNAVHVPKWCGTGTYYSNDKVKHSSEMKQIINTWHMLVQPSKPGSAHIEQK
jgi:hypothetical protein